MKQVGPRRMSQLIIRIVNQTDSLDDGGNDVRRKQTNEPVNNYLIAFSSYITSISPPNIRRRRKHYLSQVKSKIQIPRLL